MPAFVIHRMGKTPVKAAVEKDQVLIGRDPSADLVLSSETVSRHHAMVTRAPAGGWTIRCVSATNPLVVNGVLSTESVFLSEGSEILIGTEFLLVFSENDVKAAEYLGHRGYFARSQCAKCGWSGMVSALRRDPVCPKCGSRDVTPLDQYRRAAPPEALVESETRAVSGAEVRASLERLRAAKRSVLERTDGQVDRQQRQILSETTPVVIGNQPDAAFRLHGLVFGSGITISWNGSSFQARSALWFPAMRVNGRKEKTAVLKDGDLIEVGRNRFRIVTE